MADGPARRDAHGDGSTDTRGARATGPAAWVGASALRIGLAVLGGVLMLYALGRAVGVDLVEMVGRSFESPLGRWLAVAAFGLLLVGLAVRGLQ